MVISTITPGIRGDRIGYVMTLAVLTALVVGVPAYAKPQLKKVVHWKILDFQFPDDEIRKAALESGEFVPENNLPLGVEVWRNKLFVTVPRWRTGTPASLNYIDLTDVKKNRSPALRPYPDWGSHNITNETNANRIVSPFRVRADECDRLWVMDTGIADLMGENKQVTLPKILIYDLNTDKLIHTFVFDKVHVMENSLFPNIAVDVSPDHCSEAYAYVPDIYSYALIVYSLKTDTSFRVQHNFFHMDPLQGDYNVDGLNFHWPDGIFSLALAPRDEDGYRTVYFHGLSSTSEFIVNTAVLQNATAANEDYYAYKLLGTRGPYSQSTASFLDPHTGVVFYTQVNKNGVSCWNSFNHADDYSPQTSVLVASDNVTMLFPNDLKVDRDSNLWLLTDNIPTFIYSKLDYQETNFRIFKGQVKDLVKYTACEVKEKKTHRKGYYPNLSKWLSSEW